MLISPIIIHCAYFSISRVLLILPLVNFALCSWKTDSRQCARIPHYLGPIAENMNEHFKKSRVFYSFIVFVNRHDFVQPHPGAEALEGIL